MERYIQSEKIGKGTYGIVYKAKDVKTNDYVALKTIQLDEEEGIPSTAVREIALLKHLRHPNCVALQDVIHMHDKLTMVFELLELDLKKYLDVCQTGLEIITVKSLMYQLLQGISYCHKQRILHRDLKPANLLLNRAGILKIADFGLARSFAMDVAALKHEVITLWYRAPELLLGATLYSTEVDIWSIGCIFAEMVTGMPLFPGTNESDQLDRILKTMGTPSADMWPEYTSMPLYTTTLGVHPAVPMATSIPKLANDPEGADLLSKLLHVNPKHRITAEEAMSHTFFADLKRRPRRQSAVNGQAPQPPRK